MHSQTYSSHATSRFPKPGEEVIKKKYTNKVFLMAEQRRLTEKYGNLLTKSTVETSPCYSKYWSPHLHCSNRVSFNQLEAAPNIMMLGKVFLCRTITPSIKTCSLLTVVEFPDADLKDKEVFLSLNNYQHPVDEKNEGTIPVFPNGTILAVVNPMLFQPSSNQICTLRCDNPADLSVLSEITFRRLFPGLKWPSRKAKKDDLSIFKKLWPRRVGGWISVGHYWLEHKNYIGAIQAYSLALNERNAFKALTLRCSLYLKLELYKKSLEDATEILDRVPFHKKGIYYGSQSLVGMGQTEQFLRFKAQRCKLSESSELTEKLEKLMIQADIWSCQQIDGDYDVVGMLRCGMRHNHDCQEYTGSVVQQNVHGRGRGMIATEDITCGDLIVGAKALELVFYSMAREIENWPIETDTLGCQSAARVRLIVAIAHNLIRNPEVAESFYNLYDGTQTSSVSNSYTPDSNCVNVARIADICHYNSFGRSYAVGDNTEYVTGIWPAASFFNHGGFDTNSSWELCGNFMFVRASRDIVKGEEITVTYAPYTDNYADRVSTFSHYEFVCNCTLCLLDSKEPSVTRNRRKEIQLELSSLESLPVPPIALIQKLISELEEQNKDYPELNVYTVYPKMRLAKIHMRAKEYSKASKIVRDVYRFTFETVMTDVSLACCFDGMICAIHCREFGDASFWADAMRASLIQTYGKASDKLLNWLAGGVAEAMSKHGILL